MGTAVYVCVTTTSGQFTIILSRTPSNKALAASASPFIFSSLMVLVNTESISARSADVKLHVGNTCLASSTRVRRSCSWDFFNASEACCAVCWVACQLEYRPVAVPITVSNVRVARRISRFDVLFPFLGQDTQRNTVGRAYLFI